MERELTDERCECGNLLAKINDEIVEIKCRRCKRLHVFARIPGAKK
jgi:phage FluMu protein Com